MIKIKINEQNYYKYEVKKRGVIKNKSSINLDFIK